MDRNLKCLRHRFIFWYGAWFKLCILVRTVFVIPLPFLFQWCSRWRWLLFDFWHHLSFDQLRRLSFTFWLRLDARFFLIFSQTRLRGYHLLRLFCYFCIFLNHFLFHLSGCPDFHRLLYAQKHKSKFSYWSKHHMPTLGFKQLKRLFDLRFLLLRRQVQFVNSLEARFLRFPSPSFLVQLCQLFTGLQEFESFQDTFELVHRDLIQCPFELMLRPLLGIDCNTLPFLFEFSPQQSIARQIVPSFRVDRLLIFTRASNLVGWRARVVCSLGLYAIIGEFLVENPFLPTF